METCGRHSNTLTRQTTPWCNRYCKFFFFFGGRRILVCYTLSRQFKKMYTSFGMQCAFIRVVQRFLDFGQLTVGINVLPIERRTKTIFFLAHAIFYF